MTNATYDRVLYVYKIGKWNVCTYKINFLYLGYETKVKE